jgi:predicted transcriptional regulator of viral defense system
VKTKDNTYNEARRIILKNGGIIKTAEAIRAGIHPRTLYQMRNEGKTEQLSRGVYRLTDIGMTTNPDLIVVATRVPNSVICLISALSFHEMTTEIPHMIYVAIPRNAKPPIIDFTPIQCHRFSEQSFNAGIETHRIDGVDVKIYDPEKTLVDCFKFRNKIGMDVFLDALKIYKSSRKFNHAKIMKYAKTCRVYKLVKPYIEANL